MFYAFVGLIITAIAVSHLYSQVIGWLTLGMGIIVLSAVNGVLNYLHDRRYDDSDE